MRIWLVVLVSLALQGCSASAVRTGETFECPTASGPPFYAIVGAVETYGVGRHAALVTIDDPAQAIFRGIDATAVDAEVLAVACPTVVANRAVSPNFEEAAADWRAQFAAGTAGVDLLVPQVFADRRDVPLAP